jgi:hypothetical protein
MESRLNDLLLAVGEAARDAGQSIALLIEASSLAGSSP